MLDLNAGVDFDEIVPVHLVDEELGSSCVAVLDVPCDFDSIAQDSLTDLLGEMGRRSNLDDLLVATLDGAVTLEQVDAVALSISEQLDFDVPRALEESLDEDSAIAERGLGLADCTLEGILELLLAADDTHSTSSTSHGGLDDDREAMFFHEFSTVGVGLDRAGSTGDNRNSCRHS